MKSKYFRSAILSLFLVVPLVLAVSCSSPSRSEKLAPAPTALVRAINQTPEERSRSEAHGLHYIVSTEGVAATDAARSVFEQGGNIIDAAIAASFAISVERPHSTGIAGGGFLLYREANTGKVYALDFRERAPARATKNVYLDRHGKLIPNASVEGIRSVATPGFLTAMAQLYRKFGKLPLDRVMAPAVQLAESGLVVYPNLAEAMAAKRQMLEKNPESRKIFLHPDGQPYRVGEVLVQPELAQTLKKLSDAQLDEWAVDEFNEKIAQESARLRGLISLRDLRAYRLRWLDPLVSSYRGYQIVSMPPPSGGGIQIVETFNILDHFDLSGVRPQSVRAIHLFADASQLAFADRSQYVGDPDFHKIPTAQLISSDYGKRQSERIDLFRHHPSDDVGPGGLFPGNLLKESTSTTHFSIMDDQGNVVVSTQTINAQFGSGVTVPGLGVVLNDEMDDFSASPGVANIYGAVGGEVNSIAPGKTPLSSMAPTIVLRGNQPVLALGAPGGTRIGSCIAQVMLNYLEFKMPLYDAVSASRVHDQWKPDILMVESPGPSFPILAELHNMGYSLQIARDAVPCRVMAVAREGGRSSGGAADLIGVSDPRDHGSSAGDVHPRGN